jgi:hypothetical protein
VNPNSPTPQACTTCTSSQFKANETTCTNCDSTCLTCTGAAANECSSCGGGRYPSGTSCPAC